MRIKTQFSLQNELLGATGVDVPLSLQGCSGSRRLAASPQQRWGLRDHSTLFYKTA